MAITRPELTQERLKELLFYDKNSGEFTWRFKRAGVSLKYPAGHKCSRGYRRIQIDGLSYKSHRLAWLYIHGVFPPDHTDHINRIKDDNRIENLRLATCSQNLKNTGMYSNNTSGFKGVSFYKPLEKWKAQCLLNGKKRHLGYFTTRIEASEAYQVFAKANHGDFFLPSKLAVLRLKQLRSKIA